MTGGAALMDGIKELAEKVLELPVKIGVPAGFGGLTVLRALMAKLPTG